MSTPPRIALICGGLEPGRNGVGDYTLRLAEALTREGAACAVIGISDPHAETISEDAGGRFGFPILRIPRDTGTVERTGHAGRLLNAFRPDWASLHFVAYDFHPKGLVHGAIGWLPDLLRPYRCHLMLHELWIGTGVFGSLKNRLIGTAQRILIERLIRRLDPASIETSNAYYRMLLARRGIAAGLTPMFGSIPVTAATADWLPAAILAAGGPDMRHDRDSVWLAGLFGSVLPDWPAPRLFTRMEAIAARCDRRWVVVFAGHDGYGARDRVIADARGRYPHIDIVVLGPQDPARLSQLFNSLDVGLTAHPIFSLGKSSSVAAMLEHGLPVIANWGEIAGQGGVLAAPFEGLLWRCDDRLEARLMLPIVRQRVIDRAGDVARALLRNPALRGA